MNKIEYKILNAIKKGINESFNFDLDNDIEDVSVSDTIYPTKLKINKDSLLHDKNIYVGNYNYKKVWPNNPPVKVGDILYSNYTIDGKDSLTSLGDSKNGHAIAVCVILPLFLSDELMRFMSLDIIDEPEILWCDEYELNDGLVNSIPQLGNSKLSRFSTIMDTKSFYSNKFKNGYHQDALSGDKIPNPYLGLNKINNEIFGWLGMNELQGWKNTESIIAELFENGNFAALLCNNFKTYGTNSGQWYLPAIGELGIMMAKYKEINEALDDECADHMQDYWSSTQYNNEYACYLNVRESSFRFLRKNADICDIRPFLHFKLSPLFKSNDELNEGECCCDGCATFGGASGPMSTPFNTIGVGNPVPAGMPAMTGSEFAADTNLGSGDKFSTILPIATKKGAYQLMETNTPHRKKRKISKRKLNK